MCVLFIEFINSDLNILVCYDIYFQAKSNLLHNHDTLAV